MLLTTKQRLILSCLISGNERCEGSIKEWVSISELLNILPYATTKDSMQFSIRALVKKDLLVKGEKILRGGRWQIPIIPTKLAIELVPQLQTTENTISVTELDDVMFEGF